MRPKKIPEYIMINNNGKRELAEISNLPKLKLKFPKGKTIFGLVNYLEREHKEGRHKNIIITEAHDRFILTKLESKQKHR
jgi:hypothetical protein